MIWESYVFRRGVEVEELWDQLFTDRKKSGKPLRLLYVTGRGFDVRANAVLAKYVERLTASGCPVEKAELLLVGFSGYNLSTELHAQTSKNEAELKAVFDAVGSSKAIVIGATAEGEDDISSTVALRRGADEVLRNISDQTDIVLDVSSLPRVAYLTILLALLAKVLPEGKNGDGLHAKGLSLQVLVAEDAALDSKISSEDPANDLTLIPGFSEALQSEAQTDEPLVWFPVLGENRLAQIVKLESSIPEWAEICPVLPHPSRNPRRGDKLLVEYESILFAKRDTPLSNILYANESHPFEAYRQLFAAMMRYRKTMSVIGGCRMVVTPLASKLITVGTALACFEMKVESAQHRSSVAIPYAEPKRYEASVQNMLESRPVISALVLTGDAYLDSSPPAPLL
ncbi:hypothetical protein I6F35_31135 [Bradyrhizobium sp. BRP22]|uniref:hypothetical protein n=1 Tax=Bradyrhizobium sp. BRP22 TaxID=2793821 RepID=UPI001CD4375E|nr:hypothetical protein [Bradyrhizobium sp. BRP22]MCA1457598.1 hypothetical protein [Bradyrhizobium sp. BRP22]